MLIIGQPSSNDQCIWREELGRFDGRREENQRSEDGGEHFFKLSSRGLIVSGICSYGDCDGQGDWPGDQGLGG